MSEDTGEQNNNSDKYAHLKEYQFKPGQSGNPSGRPAGASMKEWAKLYFARMTEEERIEYLAGMNKDIVWKMAEGNPKQDTEIRGSLTIGEVLDELDD